MEIYPTAHQGGEVRVHGWIDKSIQISINLSNGGQLILVFSAHLKYKMFKKRDDGIAICNCDHYRSSRSNGLEPRKSVKFS